jgi:hypothetical protein
MIRMHRHLQIRQLQISHLEIFICDIGTCVVNFKRTFIVVNTYVVNLYMWYFCVLTRFC